MLPEPSLALSKKKTDADKEASNFSFFYDPDQTVFDPSTSGLYGPPNPLKRERGDAEHELFLPEPSMPFEKKAKVKSSPSPLGPFALLALPENEPMHATEPPLTDQKEKPKSSPDLFLPPWSPLEDATLVYLIHKKSNAAHVNWSYLCEFLNTQYHRRQCIRYPESVKARFERLLTLDATLLSDEERKAFSLKSFENLMYCFSMMKKRIRTKPLSRMGMGRSFLHF